MAISPNYGLVIAGSCNIALWDLYTPTILREMKVSHISTEHLQPGLNGVREKLYLASTRKTTLVEDIAYSLLGIFNASILIIYGEGTRAVGRLLEQVLSLW